MTRMGTYIAPVRATNKNVTWKSSDEKVATVDKDGKITGVSIGQATITAVTEDGQKEASDIINVVEKLPIFFKVTYTWCYGNINTCRSNICWTFKEKRTKVDKL